MQTEIETPSAIGLVNTPKKSTVRNGSVKTENSTLKEQEIVIGQLNRIIEIFKKGLGQ